MKQVLALLATTALFSAATLPIGAEPLVALLSDARVRFFDSDAPGTATRTVAITGLGTGETGVGLDIAASGECYLMTTTGSELKFYTLDLGSGAAVPSGKFQTVQLPSGVTAFGCDAPASLPLIYYSYGTFLIYQGAGSGSYGMAFDSTDQHAGATPAISGIASTNSFVGAKTFAFYGIDSGVDALVYFTFNAGLRLKTIGPLGVNAGDRVGLDISATTGIMYASIGSTLYTIDLMDGSATSKGSLLPPLTFITIADIAVLPPNRLVNLSTRSRIGTGDDVMIAGFISLGGASSQLVIRGIGPSLAANGVSGALADPVLKIFDANGTEIASNDNWKSNQQSAIEATGLAPTNDLEAAYVGSFAPGAYTAEVSGKDGTTGVGLVEIYRLQ